MKKWKNGIGVVEKLVVGELGEEYIDIQSTPFFWPNIDIFQVYIFLLGVVVLSSLIKIQIFNYFLDRWNNFGPCTS